MPSQTRSQPPSQSAAPSSQPVGTSGRNLRKKRTRSKSSNGTANGINGFMFTSPLKSAAASTSTIDKLLLQLDHPSTNSNVSTTQSKVGASEKSLNLQPSAPPQLQQPQASAPPPHHSTKQNEQNDCDLFFSPYKPRHSYNLRSSFSSSLVTLEVANEEFAKSLLGSACTNSNLSKSSFEELDMAELETEEAQDSFFLVSCVQKSQTLPISNSTPNLNFKVPSISDADPRKILVLDLDETLVHCSTDPLKMPSFDLSFPVRFQNQDFTVYLKTRPGVGEFLEKISAIYQVVIFTASQQIYADKVLDLIDPLRKFTSFRLFRDSCSQIEGTFVKDLNILQRDLSHVVIVDNAIEAFSYQISNGIPIKSWFDDETDVELYKLYKFLHSLVDCVDVRPVISKTFHLQDRVDAAWKNHQDLETSQLSII